MDMRRYYRPSPCEVKQTRLQSVLDRICAGIVDKPSIPITQIPMTQRRTIMDAGPLKPKDAPDLSSFAWDDALLLDDQLEDDERMMRDSARAYAQEKLQPRVVEAFRDEKTDPKIFREMGALGLLGVTVPEEYGGAGAGYVAYGLVAREIERVDSGYRSMMSVQSSLVMYPI